MCFSNRNSNTETEQMTVSTNPPDLIYLKLSGSISSDVVCKLQREIHYIETKC